MCICAKNYAYTLESFVYCMMDLHYRRACTDCEWWVFLIQYSDAVFPVCNMYGAIWYMSILRINIFHTIVVGFVVVDPHERKPVTCHATLIACTCDLPARALVLNMVQFNGNYGCSHCTQQGILVLLYCIHDCIIVYMS